VKFARYLLHGEIAYGVVEGEAVRPITGTPFGPYRVTDRAVPLSQVRLLAPVVPTKVFAIGLNYADHLGDREPPKKPEVFLKTVSSVIGPEEPILIPRGYTGRIDAEGEVVVVIGRRGKHIPEEQALDYILGYTCGNDVSARDWQRGDLQWWRAKSSDTFSPVGPFIATGLDPAGLDLRVRINGKEVQHGNTANLLFSIPRIVSFISEVIALEPGDLIFTGTPGIPGALQPGDVVEVEVAGVGVLRNPVQREP